MAQSSDPAIEEVIVTAQRAEESIQDVPIAVTALTAQMMEDRQVINPSDLQLNAPNVSYTATNFGGSSFSIRGIGRLVIAASGEDGVSTHINEIPVSSKRLKGAFNLPVLDNLAFRVAGMTLERDGYIENTAYGQVGEDGTTLPVIDDDVDGRDLWAIRATGEWNITDRAITGKYLTSDTSGFFRNYFLTEPRIYGASVRYSFDRI